MFTSDTYTIEYSQAELGYKAGVQILGAVLLGLIAFLSAHAPSGTCIFCILTAFILAIFACLNLRKLIFKARKTILVIAPEGIKDARLGPDFIPWAAIEKIDVPKPRPSAAMLFLNFGLIVAAFLFPDAAYVDWVEWGQPEHRIWLFLTPGQRVIGHSRAPRRSIREVGADVKQVCVATSNLTHSGQRIVDLIRGFHARYTKAVAAENAA